MKKGYMFELILFVASIALCLVTGFVYLKREDTDYRSISDNTSGLKDLVSGIQNQLNSLKKDNKDFTDILSKHGDRISDLEDKPEPEQTINLNMKEPLKVSVVYRQAQKLPDVPPQIKGKTPLLKRAGVIK